MILSLGMIDIPYASEPGTTTVMVANWLEDKYHVMEIFYHTKEADILDYLEDGLQITLESMLSGASPPDDVFASAMSNIKKDFTIFLETAEIETLGVPGVPTRASIMRRSLRFKAKQAPKARPSFIDTGLYLASFIAWTDEEPLNAIDSGSSG